MTTDITMVGLGLASVRKEGAVAHPNEIPWRFCGCPLCTTAKENQLKAYNKEKDSVEEDIDE